MKILSLYKFTIIGSLILLITNCGKKEEIISLPEISTNEIVEVTQVSAVSGGIIINDGGEPLAARGVCWSNSSNPTINNDKTIDGTGVGNYTSIITGLFPNTTYFLRAYATNSAGTKYGEELSFKTKGTNAIFGDGVTDIDGNLYQSVIIGEQEWMAENLRVTKYNNGDEILTGLSNSDWENTNDAAYSIYDHNLFYADGIDSPEEMVEAYGKLYNGYATIDDRGLCPVGWRVPTETDWSLLIDYVEELHYLNKNIVNGAGNAIKSCRQTNSIYGESCATSEHPRWDSSGFIVFGFDAFGFSGLPSGYRNNDGRYFAIGRYVSWWSSPAHIDSNAWYRSINFTGGHMIKGYGSMTFGLSVRCIRE